MHGEVPLGSGGVATPVFMLMTETYMVDAYSQILWRVQLAFPQPVFANLPQTWLMPPLLKRLLSTSHGLTGRAKNMRPWLAAPSPCILCAVFRLIQMAFRPAARFVLQLMLGSIEVPGGWRFKPPYPKPLEAHSKPAGKPDQVQAGKPLTGAPLGYVLGPDDLLLNSEGEPQRIDKAYSWDAPMAAHGLMHMVISNAVAGDPYHVDVLFMYMANMAWNSSMNTRGVMEMLTEKIQTQVSIKFLS